MSREELKNEINYLEHLSKDLGNVIEKIKYEKEMLSNGKIFDGVVELESIKDALDFTIVRLKKFSEAV